MLPYAHLDIPHKLITHRLQQYVFASGLIENGSFFNKVDAETTHKAIPELRDLFAQYGLNDLGAMCIIKVQGHMAIAPHRDWPPFEEQQEPKKAVAVNWPIFNCNNTFTAFYDEKTNIQNLAKGKKLTNGLGYINYDIDQVEETHRIKIEVPTAFRFDVIHAVINDTDDHRWTASFRFKTNHWELFGN